MGDKAILKSKNKDILVYKIVDIKEIEEIISNHSVH